jgi:hypothetical protein
MSEWTPYKIVQQAEFHRAGWAGVWDAIVSAVTGKERYLLAKPVTISFYAKHGADVSFNSVQIELKE